MNDDNECPFDREGPVKYALPDDYNSSSVAREFSDDSDKFSMWAQSTVDGLEMENITPQKDEELTFPTAVPLPQTKMLRLRENGSDQTSDSRASKRKARVDYASGSPGHHQDVSAEELQHEQQIDDSLKVWREKANTGDIQFTFTNRLLYKRIKDQLNKDMWQLCVPVPYRSLVLSLAHRPGHPGRDRTLQRVQDEFCWPGIFNEVKQLCKACLNCQLADKLSPYLAPLRPLLVIHTPFQQIGMDMVEPLPTTAAGNLFILVIVDYATRWPKAFPLRFTESETVAYQLLLLFTRVGLPNKILTDSGPNFVSRLPMELYKLLGVTSITTTLYYSATDGLVERYNGIIKSMIRKMSKLWHSQWDLALPFLLGELRRSPSATTGFTPS